MNETLKTIHGLHSTHGNFSSRDISDEDLQTIIKAGLRASNASNRQSYSIIVVEDRADMKEYLGYAGSKALIFCVDYKRLEDTADYLGHTYHHNGIIDFVTGTTDTALAAQTSVIAAKSLGIDFLITNSVHRGDLDKLYKKFKLPKLHCFPILALILGYSNSENGPIRGRLEGPGVVHYGAYTKLDEEQVSQIVNAYDIEGKNMGLCFYNRSSSPYKRYLDWYFKKWCSPESEATKKKRVEFTNMLKEVDFIE